MNFEKKIELILLKLEPIEARMNNMDEKFNNLTARINKVETKFEIRNEEIGSICSQIKHN